MEPFARRGFFHHARAAAADVTFAGVAHFSPVNIGNTVARAATRLAATSCTDDGPDANVSDGLTAAGRSGRRPGSGARPAASSISVIEEKSHE